jgi:hypothetical protein
MTQKASGIQSSAAVAPKILLTDTCRWSVGARLAIAFSKAGCEVFALCSTYHHPLQYARGVKHVFRYSSLRPLESLEDAINRCRPDIVIPCDERGVRHLHELFVCAKREATKGSIADLIERSLGSPESYPIVSSRYDLLRIASEEGICVPDTRAIREVADLQPWRTKQALPWVLKSDCTFGGSGVEIAQTPEQAELGFLRMAGPHTALRVLKRLIINRDSFWIRPWWQRQKPGIIAQAHIQGYPANCAVVCWQGQVLAGIGVDVISSTGVTGPATVVRIVDSPEMMTAAEKIARRLSLSGFFGLDFMISDEDGRAYLIEMNPRCTTVCHLQLGKGRDMVGALCAQLSGQPMAEACSVTEQETIAYFPQAWTSNDNLLHSSFQDIPSDEPELVRELLHPWPNRTLLYRLTHALTNLRVAKP